MAAARCQNVQPFEVLPTLSKLLDRLLSVRLPSRVATERAARPSAVQRAALFQPARLEQYERILQALLRNPQLSQHAGLRSPTSLGAVHLGSLT